MLDILEKSFQRLLASPKILRQEDQNNLFTVTNAENSLTDEPSTFSENETSNVSRSILSHSFSRVRKLCNAGNTFGISEALDDNYDVNFEQKDLSQNSPYTKDDLDLEFLPVVHMERFLRLCKMGETSVRELKRSISDADKLDIMYS